MELNEKEVRRRTSNLSHHPLVFQDVALQTHGMSLECVYRIRVLDIPSVREECPRVQVEGGSIIGLVCLSKATRLHPLYFVEKFISEENKSAGDVVSKDTGGLEARKKEGGEKENRRRRF